MDNAFSTNPAMKYYLLLGVTLAIIVLGASVYVWIAEAGAESYGAALW